MTIEKDSIPPRFLKRNLAGLFLLWLMIQAMTLLDPGGFIHSYCQDEVRSTYPFEIESEFRLVRRFNFLLFPVANGSSADEMNLPTAAQRAVLCDIEEYSADSDTIDVLINGVQTPLSKAMYRSLPSKDVNPSLMVARLNEAIATWKSSDIRWVEWQRDSPTGLSGTTTCILTIKTDKHGDEETYSYQVEDGVVKPINVSVIPGIALAYEEAGISLLALVISTPLCVGAGVILIWRSRTVTVKRMRTDEREMTWEDRNEEQRD